MNDVIMYFKSIAVTVMLWIVLTWLLNDVRRELKDGASKPVAVYGITCSILAIIGFAAHLIVTFLLLRS